MICHEHVHGSNSLSTDAADTAAGSSILRDSPDNNAEKIDKKMEPIGQMMRKSQSMNQLLSVSVRAPESFSKISRRGSLNGNDIILGMRGSLDGGKKESLRVAAQNLLPRRRSSMSVRTLDDSLHGSTNSFQGESDISRQRRRSRRLSSMGDSMRSVNSTGSLYQLSVSFNKVEIREYPWVLGDNPSVSCGPPLQIDWIPNEDSQEIDIDVYESNRPERRKYLQMVMPESVRREILDKQGYSRRQIDRGVREANIRKGNRRKTNRMLHAANVEEKLEKTVRAISSKVGRRKKKERKLLEESMKVEEVANQLRAEAWAAELLASSSDSSDELLVNASESIDNKNLTVQSHSILVADMDGQDHKLPQVIDAASGMDAPSPLPIRSTISATEA